MDAKSAFQAIDSLWKEKLNLASARKWKEFGQYAEECWQFYSGPNDASLYKQGDQLALESFGLAANEPRVVVNKCFEANAVFLPYLHNRNPTRLITDRRPKVPPELKLATLPPEYLMQVAADLYRQGVPIDPMNPVASAQQYIMQQEMQKSAATDANWQIRKILLESVLNYTPNEFDLTLESRAGLTDAIVAGRGVWWTEMIQGPHGYLPGTVHVPVRQFIVDPDFYKPRDWTWVAREKSMPKYKFAELFGIDEKELNTTQTGDESNEQKARIKVEGREYERYRPTGETHDIVYYWEVYSRCGVGTYLDGIDEELRGKLTEVGDNVVLIISDCYDQPLNLRDDLFEVDNAADGSQQAEMVKRGLQWPIPYWKDSAWPWPFALCDFHHQDKSAWPISHLRPALGIQRTINWIWSMVAEKIKKTTHGKWLYNSSLDEDTLNKMATTLDQEWVPVKLRVNERMSDVAMELVSREMNKDTFTVAQYFETLFEQATGVSALLTTGESSRQMRSSYEAQLREKIIQSRPEAMADSYEETQSRCARNESIALRMIPAGAMASFFHEQYDPMNPQATGEYTQLWGSAVFTEDEDAIVAETDARVEAGSMRKPNVGEALAGINESMQAMMPTLMQEYTATGNPQNINILFGEYSKRVMPTMPPIQLQPLQMMPPQPPPEEKGAA